MATITPRDSGGWQAKVRKQSWPVQSKTFRTKSAAETWAKQVEADMDRGLYRSTTDAERTTVAEIIDRFTTEFAPHHYRARADQKEAWRFQCARLRVHLGAYSLAVLDQKLVANYRDKRLKGDERCEAVGPATVRKEVFMLSKVLRFAETECGIALPRGNPVEKIRIPKDGKARDRRLSAEEWSSLEAQCRRSRNRYLWPAVVLSVETAMRQGELLGLRWQDVDFARRIALLELTKNGEARAAPLSNKAIETLRALPRHLHGPIIPVERLTLYHAFVAACQRADIDDYTWHDLRHEALSRLAERGDLSVFELASVSGHKTLQMLKRYTHLQAEALARKLG